MLTFFPCDVLPSFLPCHNWFLSLSACCVVVFILVNQCLKNGSDGMFEHSQLVGGTWEWAYATLCFSCGYFAYDQLDMLFYRLYSGSIPSILVHHMILLVCFTLALYRNVTINYLILTLVCEVWYFTILITCFCLNVIVYHLGVHASSSRDVVM